MLTAIYYIMVAIVYVSYYAALLGGIWVFMKLAYACIISLVEDIMAVYEYIKEYRVAHN